MAEFIANAIMKQSGIDPCDGDRSDASRVKGSRIAIINTGQGGLPATDGIMRREFMAFHELFNDDPVRRRDRKRGGNRLREGFRVFTDRHPLGR